MSVFITFAAALLIFGAVIAIHEFGHFAVAKLCGVQVNEFSIGMGPTLIKTYRKGRRALRANRPRVEAGTMTARTSRRRCWRSGQASR